MSITIDLPRDLEEALQRQVARTGRGLRELVVEAVQEKIARANSFEQVCAQFAHAVDASGISEPEFSSFFEEVREEAWRERHDNAK